MDLYRYRYQEGISELFFELLTMLNVFFLEYTFDDIVGGKCLQLPENIKDRARSLNTRGNCIVLYTDQNCHCSFRGFMPGSPYHYDLSGLGFHKGPGSIELC